MPVMEMGRNLQLILLLCMLAGASAIPSLEEPQGFKELGEEASMSLTGDMVRFANGTELQLFPASEAHIQEHINGTRRILGVFRQCSPCTCCDKTRRWCLPTVCCYNISEHQNEAVIILGGRFSRLVSGICLPVKRSVGVLTVLKRKMNMKVEDAANWFTCFMQ